MTTLDDGLAPNHEPTHAREAVTAHALQQHPAVPHARAVDTDPVLSSHRDRDPENARKLEALGSLASSIAHDFHGALRTITGNTSLAQHCLSEDHPAHAFLDEVASAGARASELVQRIMTFSAPQTAGEPAPRHQVPGEPAPHVLFVDDEDVLVVLGTHMLEVLGYRVTGTALPLDALRTFAERPHDFDAVVTDLSMPGLSGFQLAQQLLALRLDVPIVMMSGNVGPDELSHARKLGIRELLLKPVGMDDLHRTLARVLARGVLPLRRRAAIHKT